MQHYYLKICFYKFDVRVGNPEHPIAVYRQAYMSIVRRERKWRDQGFQLSLSCVYNFLVVCCLPPPTHLQ